MALPEPTFEGIKKAIKARNFAPVFLLHGEEGYFTDALASEFETILSEDEKAFNQYILYAPETEPAQIIDICRRIPVMSEYQVVIVKEAQNARADKLAKLIPYLSAPTATTILVICCRGAQAKGKDLTGAIKKGGGVVFCRPTRSRWKCSVTSSAATSAVCTTKSTSSLQCSPLEPQ